MRLYCGKKESSLWRPPPAAAPLGSAPLLRPGSHFVSTGEVISPVALQSGRGVAGEAFSVAKNVVLGLYFYLLFIFKTVHRILSVSLVFYCGAVHVSHLRDAEAGQKF